MGFVLNHSRGRKQNKEDERVREQVSAEPPRHGPRAAGGRRSGPGPRIPFGERPTRPTHRVRHSPVPGPCGPAAAITPACAVTVPLGSSTRDLLTSGSPVEEAEVAAVAGVAGVAGVAAAAAGSSGPTSHTRVTTTGVDELAWAARSCRGLVRARSGGKETCVGNGRRPAQASSEHAGPLLPAGPAPGCLPLAGGALPAAPSLPPPGSRPKGLLLPLPPASLKTAKGSGPHL